MLIRFVHHYQRAETRALIARMSTEPPRALGNKIDTLLGHLIDDGFLARMDTLYVPWKMHTQQAALLDWKRPTGAATLHGSATWDPAFGFVGSGNPTAYINSHYNPATGATNFSLNSFSVGSFVTAAGTGALDLLFGSRDSAWRSLSLFESTYNAYEAYACATTNTYTADNQVGTGLLVLQRTASNAVAIYKNGTGIAFSNQNAASVSIPSFDLYICGNNDKGTANGGSTAKIGVWWAGDDFTPAEQTAMKGYFDAYAA